MEQLSIPYFRDLYSKNVCNLKIMCKDWERRQTDSSVPEEVRDEIRTAIGLTNLLLSQKLKQFSGLIDDSEFKKGEKEITCLDLQGFWDMVYNEVEKIHKSFEKLEKCKENNWVFVSELPIKSNSNKKLLPAIAKSIVSTKKHTSAARQRLAEAKLKMKQQMAAQNGIDEVKTAAEEMIQRGRKSNRHIPEKSTEIKSTISNITNMQISEQKTLQKSSSSKKKPRSKNLEPVDKENIITSQPLDSGTKLPSSRRVKEKPKNFIPLQCVTRSAARMAMQAKQNGTKME